MYHLLMALVAVIFLLSSGCFGKKEKDPSLSSEKPSESTEAQTTSAERKPAIIKEGAVGAFSVVDSTNPESVKIKIIFPREFVSDEGSPVTDSSTPYNEWTYPVQIEKELRLYDKEGLLVELPAPTGVEGKFWCENDGGAQYRPEFIVEVAKESLKRIPQSLEGTTNTAGVVMVGRGSAPEELSFKPSAGVKVIAQHTVPIEKSSVGLIISEDNGMVQYGPYVWMILEDRKFDLNCSGP